MTLEEKMKIVINNYFKKECSVNTSIREAFEKGFRIGASKVQKKHGKWINGYCSECGGHAPYWAMASAYHTTDFCPHCGADMREVTSIPSECEGDCGWCKPSVIEECKGVTE